MSGGRYLRELEGHGAAANWDEFADSLGESFLQEVKDRHLADRFLESPPEKQIVENGCLGWKSVPIGNVRTLFEAVRRLRNNLFHGAKFPPEPARDRQLLTEALMILEFALTKSRAVCEIFKPDK
jgi:hypothetical protein